MASCSRKDACSLIATYRRSETVWLVASSLSLPRDYRQACSLQLPGSVDAAVD